jgi:hypothetical protein
MPSITRLRKKSKRGVAEIIAAIFVILIIFVAFGVFTIMFNSFASYTKQANQVNQQEAQNAQTSISLSSFVFGSNGAPVNSYGTSCGTTATQYSDGSKLVYASGMWFSFFICDVSGTYDLVFTSSYDSVTWGALTTVITSLSSSDMVSTYLVGNTIYIAISQAASTSFDYVTGTLNAGGSVLSPLGSISEASGSPCTYCVSTGNGANKEAGPISIEVDSSGNEWVAVTGNGQIGVFEHPASSAANSGWSSNIAPSSLGSLSTGAVPIILAPPSGISTVGAVLIYQSGSGTAQRTSQISMITTISTTGATWNTVISLGGGGLSDYSLTSSSAVMDGYVLCFAGLASASSGASTGTLDFWNFQFTSSISSGILSAQTVIESAVASWQAALTLSSSSLELFDNPSGTSIKSYVSSNIGSTWSVSTTEATGETAINGLSPAFGSPAVTWTNSGGVVRFLALSSLTLTNNSGFPVELVSLFVSNPSTNTLVATYFKNSSALFDYWTGAGNTVTTPAYFSYSASSSYLVTVVTSTGIIVSSTFSSLA